MTIRAGVSTVLGLGLLATGCAFDPQGRDPTSEVEALNAWFSSLEPIVVAVPASQLMGEETKFELPVPGATTTLRIEVASLDGAPLVADVTSGDEISFTIVPAELSELRGYSTTDDLGGIPADRFGQQLLLGGNRTICGDRMLVGRGVLHFDDGDVPVHVGVARRVVERGPRDGNPTPPSLNDCPFGSPCGPADSGRACDYFVCRADGSVAQVFGTCTTLNDTCTCASTRVVPVGGPILVDADMTPDASVVVAADASVETAPDAEPYGDAAF